MYDPTIGQFLSEDPIEFEGLDENLRRYVRNRSISATDPSGLSLLEELAQNLFAMPTADFDVPIPTRPTSPPGTATYPIDPSRYPPLFVYLNFIDLSTAKNSGAIANSAIDGANAILCQAGVVLQHNGFTKPPVDSGRGPTTYNADTDTFSGGGLDGKKISEVLAFSESNPNIVTIILVDRVIARDKLSFGVNLKPGNPRGAAIVLAINYGFDKNADTPERTLSHECANYFGIPDRKPGDPNSLMSYGKYVVDAFIRGNLLTAAEIDALRRSIILR